MLSHLTRLLFPAEPRQLPGRRGLKIALRSGHVLCAGVLVGAFVFAAGAELRAPWFWGTLLSGLLLLLLDLHETAAFLLQVRGLVVVVKLGLLASLPLLAGGEAWVLGALLCVSVLSSHAPSKVRYFLLAGRGRIRPARSKG